jgi:hypothetical protein
VGTLGVFSKYRDRLLIWDVAQRFFAEVTLQAKKFMSDEHFTVDAPPTTFELERLPIS